MVTGVVSTRYEPAQHPSFSGRKGIDTYDANDVVTVDPAVKDATRLLAFSPHAGIVAGDVFQFEQFPTNFVVNARDAMPTGGAIGLETRSVDRVARYDLEHTGGLPDPHVVTVVSDTGIGMAPEVLGRIFESSLRPKTSGRALA